MRVLSIALGVVAAASLAVAGPCKPSKVVASSSSSAAPSSSSSASPSASPSSVCVPPTAGSVTTFNIQGANSANSAINGQYCANAGDGSALEFAADSGSGYTVDAFYIDSTGYLRLECMYVYFTGAASDLIVASAATVQSNQHIPLVCEGTVSENAVLTCYPDGMPGYSQYVNKYLTSDLLAYELNPSETVNLGANFDSFDLVAVDVSAAQD
ncbi:hypothetical protein SEUCBS139899_010489 [Sporothrix eucalyptigena]|uniref:Uncharacterized protein n=1 Tax=Sporothrix eucalyptigena TaxID=1812306 RepID=A0ABP0CS09_9PEZI